MANTFTANITNWFKTKLNTVANNIKMNGTQNAGSSDFAARADHVHPTDTSRAAAVHNHTKSDITDFPVIPPANSVATNIKMDGIQSAGSLSSVARADHVHPTDTSRAASNHTHTNLVTQEVPANANLNDYTTPGIYKCESNAIVKTMTNTPWGDNPSNGQAFSLIVLKHAGTAQIMRPYNHNEYNIYMRNFYNNTWGKWTTIYTDGNLVEATTSKAGLMSSADKTKLNGINTSLYLPLSGGTMSGRLFIPTHPDTENPTGNVPTSRRIQNTAKTVHEIAKENITLIGSIYGSDKLWYNALSIRHGNGQGDGNKYGLLLKAPLNQEGDLTWNQHIADTWKSTKTILDSSNFTNYIDNTKASGSISLASGFSGTVKWYQRGPVVIVNCENLKYSAATTMRTFGSVPLNPVNAENIVITHWEENSKTQIKLTPTGTLQFYSGTAEGTFTGQLMFFADS